VGVPVRGGQPGDRRVVGADRPDREHALHEPAPGVHQPRAAGPDVHVVLVLDQAGWHVAKALVVPTNVTLLYLPPYAPELNGAERIWSFLRSHYLSNRIYKDYDALFEAIKTAWNSLATERLKSLTHTEWIERAA
jgi:transposase